MKLDDLYQIWECLNACSDFVASNGDGDESGIVSEMMSEIGKAEAAVRSEIKKIQLRNAIKRVKRAKNKN